MEPIQAKGSASSTRIIGGVLGFHSLQCGSQHMEFTDVFRNLRT
jgi:hypothetical protein